MQMHVLGEVWALQEFPWSLKLLFLQHIIHIQKDLKTAVERSVLSHKFHNIAALKTLILLFRPSTCRSCMQHDLLLIVYLAPKPER